MSFQYIFIYVYATLSAKKTPKRTPTKRPAAPDTTPKSAKKRNTRKSDPGDPFNFDAKKDEHPDLLEKVQVERQSFGGMKFYNKDNKDGSKYANLEKNASERRQLVPELLVKSPLPSLSNSTPKSAKSTRSTPSSAKRGSKNAKSEKSEDTKAIDFEEDESEPEEKPTPKAAKKKKPAEEAVAKTPKVCFLFTLKKLHVSCPLLQICCFLYLCSLQIIFS